MRWSVFTPAAFGSSASSVVSSFLSINQLDNESLLNLSLAPPAPVAVSAWLDSVVTESAAQLMLMDAISLGSQSNLWTFLCSSLVSLSREKSLSVISDIYGLDGSWEKREQTRREDDSKASGNRGFVFINCSVSSPHF